MRTSGLMKYAGIEIACGLFSDTILCFLPALQLAIEEEYPFNLTFL